MISTIRLWLMNLNPWFPSKWGLRWRLWLWREQLALDLWSGLTPEQRHHDDVQIMKQVGDIVAWCESGVSPSDASRLALTPLIQHFSGLDHCEQIKTTARQLQCIHAQLYPNITERTLPWSVPVQALPDVSPLWPHVRMLYRMRRKLASEPRRDMGLSLENANGLVPLVSAVLLISGYFYTSLLLSHYGINTSEYFSLSDYLAASIEGLLPALLSAGLSVLMSVFTANQILLGLLQRQLRIHLWSKLVLFTLIVGVISLLWRISNSALFLVLPMLIIAIVLPSLALRFARPLRAQIMMTFVLLDVSMIVFSVGMHHQHFAKPARASDLREIVLSNGKLEDPLQWVIAGNSTYLFVQDRHHRISIIPLQNVAYVRVPAAQSSESTL